MSSPAIGALRRRVTLEAETRTADGGGGSVLGWVGVTDLWAELRGLSGSETLAAEDLQAKVTHMVTIRRRMDVRPDMRIRFGQRLFHIVAVLDRDGPEPFLRILAEERNL